MIEVPAREGCAARVAACERFRIVDREGEQVVDLFAFSAEDCREYASAARRTRVNVGRLFPAVGEAFVTNRRQPLLLLTENSSPGIHDMLFAACDPTRYRQLGVRGPYASCQENLLEGSTAARSQMRSA